jgi:hypothetical protein
VKLPDKCPYLRSAKHWIPYYEDAAPCCRIDDFDLAVFLPRQVPMCGEIRQAVEAYRFIWRSRFQGEALVHVSKGEKTIGLEWACRGRQGQGRFSKILEPDDWTRLESALLAAEFWEIALEEKKSEETVRLEGASWVIEGRRREIYGVVRLNNPRGPLHDLGRAFFDIAGPPITDIALH